MLKNAAPFYLTSEPIFDGADGGLAVGVVALESAVARADERVHRPDALVKPSGERREGRCLSVSIPSIPSVSDRNLDGYTSVFILLSLYFCFCTSLSVLLPLQLRRGTLHHSCEGGSSRVYLGKGLHFVAALEGCQLVGDGHAVQVTRREQKMGGRERGGGHTGSH